MANDSESAFDTQLVTKVRDYLARLQKEPKSNKRNLKAIGCIFDAVSTMGIGPVLVGGQAIEIYTFGNVTTVDFDLVVDARYEFGDFLEAVGFEKQAGDRHWFHEDLELPIEIPDTRLIGSADKISDIQVDEFVVPTIGVEDLILDRLRGAVYWNDTRDIDTARFLVSGYKNELDISYMKQVAQQEDKRILDYLEVLLA